MGGRRRTVKVNFEEHEYLLLRELVKRTSLRTQAAVLALGMQRLASQWGVPVPEEERDDPT